jgi:predicted MPP superfamily phosphohydrolase
VASLGNHDYWSDPDAINCVLKDQSIPRLNGSGVEMSFEGEKFKVYADDRPWGLGLSAKSGGFDAPPSMVLSHSPDNIFQLIKMPSCRAVFSGHVHAGQFRFPLPWSGLSTSLVLPSAHGRRLDHGHFIFEGNNDNLVHLFVSAGVGAAEPPLRIYCPPEMLVVRFRKSTR